MSKPTVSEATAKEYLNSIAPTITRIEYLFHLQEAFEEGQVMRDMGAQIESKEQWGAIDHWSRFTPELRDEFYIAYRAGYKRGGAK